MHKRDSRPDPDELLAQINAREKQEKRGKLKIFLGYAAGVGKTFTMLEAAHQREKELDVVVAYVETHGRAETEALLEGLEIMPRKQVEYRGLILTEMDLDAILERRPQLALVDELAHTNAQGSRNTKRYQDVEELLEAGIDVYSTLNIQHIESLRNMVAQITGVWVRETVPDNIINNAVEIELVDLTPNELLKRLKEGKVYITEQIALATTDFFRRGNLIALRELAMRTAAERVDEQVRSYMGTHDIHGPWPTAERLLVCISPSHSSTRLVRTARRLASQLNVEWFAIYIETPNNIHLSPEQQKQLMNTRKLAERLGATVVTAQGHSVVTAIIEYARKNNITKILIGKSQSSRWRRLVGGSVVNQIIRQSEHIDVYVVSGIEKPEKREKVIYWEAFQNWRGYLQGFGLVILATLLGKVLSAFVAPTNIIMIYLLCVVVTSVFWGLGASIMVSVLSVLAFDFFLVPPSLTFAVEDTQYIFTFIVLILVGIVISYLASRIRLQTEAAMRREHETATLYDLSRNLATTYGLETTISAVLRSARETFGSNAIIFLSEAEGKDKLKPYTENPNLSIDENEYAAAIWSFQHQKLVGQGTDTLPNAKARYLPLNTARGAVGVMALYLSTSGQLTAEQGRLLEAFNDLAAVAIERTLLAEKVQNTQILEATEKLQTALLNSISHDLRTPLVSVIGVLSSLKEGGIELDEAARRNLIQVAYEEAERLNHLIANLLDSSRIESGAININRQPSEVQEIVSVALEQLGGYTIRHPITINISTTLPFVSVDFGLMVQVFVNILDNAFKYSPPDSPIDISAKHIANEVKIEIADRGIGVPALDLTRIFDKFYRIQHRDSVTGTGLGLSICKGIVEAHGGQIMAENRVGGGTVLRLTLPVTEAMPTGGGKSL